MKYLIADTGPKMVLDITDEERNIAKEIKEDSKVAIKKLEAAVRVITDLRDAITEERPEKDTLKTKYHGRLLRYKRKIVNTFNDFLNYIKICIEKMVKINDPDMARLRDIIIAEIGELSDGTEAIMDLLDDIDRDKFTQTLEQITAQMEKREKSIHDVIDNQLANHIDHDIFGKLRISQLKFRVQKRSRIVKQLIK